MLTPTPCREAQHMQYQSGGKALGLPMSVTCRSVDRKLEEVIQAPAHRPFLQVPHMYGAQCIGPSQPLKQLSVGRDFQRGPNGGGVAELTPCWSAPLGVGVAALSSPDPPAEDHSVPVLVGLSLGLSPPARSWLSSTPSTVTGSPTDNSPKPYIWSSASTVGPVVLPPF